MKTTILNIRGIDFEVTEGFVNYQTGMFDGLRQMEITRFEGFVKDYVNAIGRNGAFLEPSNNKRVDNELYPI
jgi:hypothetical protein